MKACAEFETLILDRASGEPVAPADAARFGLHLVGCPGCRADEAATREALGLAALPPPAPAELARLDAELAPRVRTAWRQAQARRSWLRGAAAGLLAAAATALLLALPRWPAPAAPRAEQPASGTRVTASEELEAWAMGGTLAETLDAEPEQRPSPGRQALDSQTYADLYLNPGE